MSEKTSMYTYELADGRTAMSPISLIHALDKDKHLNLDELTAEEQQHLSVIANPLLGMLAPIVFDGEAWEPPSNLLAMNRIDRAETSFYRNCCVLQNGEIYIRNGAFVSLDVFLSNATTEDLRCALYSTAAQAALAQMDRMRASAATQLAPGKKRSRRKEA